MPRIAPNLVQRRGAAIPSSKVLAQNRRMPRYHSPLQRAHNRTSRVFSGFEAGPRPLRTNGALRGPVSAAGSRSRPTDFSTSNESNHEN